MVNEPDKPLPVRALDFWNGGIDIICADSIDARGDINLNGVPNEIADAVLFSNYFVYGLGVFNVNMAGQIAATDVNADGLTLSVADLVYLVRLILGDAVPYSKVAPVNVQYYDYNGTLNVDSEMGAAYVVVSGNVVPELMTDKMDMLYNFDGENTHVLVWSQAGHSFNGDFVSIDGEIVSVELATVEGFPVNAKLIPTSYALSQNYPNPFNPSTTISFSLPKATDYTLTVYNVTGQVVAEFAGNAPAGHHSVIWEADNNASGVYFYRLYTNDFSDTKKMVLLK
jgi:hypothetical protein